MTVNSLGCKMDLMLKVLRVLVQENLIIVTNLMSILLGQCWALTEKWDVIRVVKLVGNESYFLQKITPFEANCNHVLQIILLCVNAIKFASGNAKQRLP